MQLIPQSGRVAVERLAPEKKTPGGLWLPDASAQKNETVKVLAVSDGWVDDRGNERASRYRPGDFLLVSKYSGEEFELDRGRLKISLVREQDVLALMRLDDDDTHLPDAVRSEAPPPVEIGTEDDRQSVAIGDVPPAATVAADDPRLGAIGDAGPQQGPRPLDSQQAMAAKAELMASMGWRG